MRKTALALASVVVMIAACGGGDENPPPKAPETPAVDAAVPAPSASVEPPKTEAPKPSLAEMQMKNGRAYGEALNAHDAKKLASLYAEGAVVKVAGAPDVTGRDAIAASYQKLFDAFSGYKSMPSRIFSKGEVVVVEWAFNGTHSGDLWGIKATEKPVGAMGVDVMWFSADGQIKEQHTYYDGATILSQIGISKQKARPIPQLGTRPEVITSAAGPDEQKNADVVKGISASLDAKKEADFLGAFSDGIEFDEMTVPQTMKGKAEAKKFYGAMTTGFPDAKHEVTNVWGINDYVVSEVTLTGTHKGAFMGIPATKKSLNVRGVEITQLKDGKVVKGAAYSNGAEFAMQLGLMPMPGAKPGGDKKPTDAKAPAATPKK